MDALQELRALLPEAADSQLRAGGEQGLTEQTLRRWLVARKMNVQVAAADLAAHAAWRAAWVPQQRITEDEIMADLKQDKVFVQGTDQHGRGVIILQAARHTLTECTGQQRYIAYCLDAAIWLSDTSRNPDDKVVGIFELQGIGLRNLDAMGLKNVFMLLQSHYVERLSKLFMVGAPAIFWGLWRVISPFIDPVTREKVVFVSAKETQLLAQDVGVEVLPAHLGGTAKLVPVQVAWQKLLQQRQQESKQQLETGDAQPADCGSTCRDQGGQEHQLSQMAAQLQCSGANSFRADAAVLVGSE